MSVLGLLGLLADESQGVLETLECVWKLGIDHQDLCHMSLGYQFGLRQRLKMVFPTSCPAGAAWRTLLRPLCQRRPHQASSPIPGLQQRCVSDSR